MPHLHSLNLYVINNGLKKCETEINGTIGLVYRLCFPCDLVLQIHLAAKYLNNLFIVKNNVHNNSINITYTINTLHVSALLSHHQAQTSRTTVFQFCLTVFELLHWGSLLHYKS